MPTIENTLAERGARYGDYEEQARLAIHLYESLNPRDARYSTTQAHALFIICTKLARIANGDPNYADNWHDIAGYATLVEQRLPGESHKAVSQPTTDQ